MSLLNYFSIHFDADVYDDDGDSNGGGVDEHLNWHVFALSYESSRENRQYENDGTSTFANVLEDIHSIQSRNRNYFIIVIFIGGSCLFDSLYEIKFICKLI